LRPQAKIAYRAFPIAKSRLKPAFFAVKGFANLRSAAGNGDICGFEGRRGGKNLGESWAPQPRHRRFSQTPADSLRSRGFAKVFVPPAECRWGAFWDGLPNLYRAFFQDPATFANLTVIFAPLHASFSIA